LRRDEKDLEARLKLVPLGRAGTPEEVAALIEFLLSEGAGFITGEVITMSGGDQL
jgi:3-oxoacyl-[acyl-carrier protein] reductase